MHYPYIRERLVAGELLCSKGGWKIILAVDRFGISSSPSSQSKAARPHAKTSPGIALARTRPFPHRFVCGVSYCIASNTIVEAVSPFATSPQNSHMLL